MKISIIIPFFNNEESIPELFESLDGLMKHEIFTDHHFEWVLVEDGSFDNTYEVLKQTARKYSQPAIKLIKLARNFGSYNAFLAGMHHATGDCCVHLHADLQDPPELISKLFENYMNGYKLVIANRGDREDKSIFSDLYHWMVRKIALPNTPTGGFDLMLFDKQIKNDIVKISEKNTNQVYLISWLGYPYVSIPYKRLHRKHGKSQWAFWKKVRLFIDTFFSFSDFPVHLVRLSFYASLLFFMIMVFLYIIQIEINHHKAFLWGSFVLSVLTFNASIIVEFLARIHESVRNRPNFVVDEEINFK